MLFLSLSRTVKSKSPLFTVSFIGGNSPAISSTSPPSESLSPFTGSNVSIGNTHGPAEIVQHDLCISNICDDHQPYVRIFFFIKFIFDVSDDFFQNIFHSNNTACTSKFIHHNCKMNSLGLKFFKKIINQFGFRNK